VRRAAIERLLPLAYQRVAADGGVLAALLDVMEALHAPDEEILARVDDLYAAYRSPDQLTGFLARWVAMDHVGGAQAHGVAPGRLRDVVADAAALAQWRGTPDGLLALLRTATGVAGIAVEEPADRPFHLRVRLPHTAAGQLDLVTRLVRAEKPAATTCEVLLDDAPPPPGGGAGAPADQPHQPAQPDDKEPQ
jgi:phage tail-like protein